MISRDLLAPLGLTRTTPRPQPPHATGYAVHPYADVLLDEPEHDAGAMAPAALDLGSFIYTRTPYDPSAVAPVIPELSC